ncbi:MAG: RsmE family RNA methyltransferase [Actinomycetota bacterium]
MADAEALRHRPLLFVEDLDHPRLSDADHHHFRRVLRVEAGADIVIGDGVGGWRPARYAPEPEPTGPIAHVERPAAALTVAFTPVKGARAEWVVQKLTELGVDTIALVETERSVVRWDGDRRDKQQIRLAGAAREACLQSRRLVLPTVLGPQPLAAFIDANPAAVLADPGGRNPTAEDRVIVIGPEGGFSAQELDGRPTVRLPGHILRAETAAIAAAGLITAIRTGLL